MDLNYCKKIYSQLLEDYQGRRGELRKKDAEKSLESFSGAYVKDEIVRWKSNDSIPPYDLLILWNGAGNNEFSLEKSIEQRIIEVSAEIEAYRKAQAGRVRTEEELAEMRAAFGEGTIVVDLISREKIII